MQFMRKKITSEGKEKIKQKLLNLKNEREEVLKQLVEARSQGDLRENDAYNSSKLSLKKIDQDINKLAIELHSSIVEDIKKSDKVIFGSKVIIENQANQEKSNYQIVSDNESDIFEGLLSEVSPLAQSMLGKTQGEIFKVITPAGIEKIFKICEIN